MDGMNLPGVNGVRPAVPARFATRRQMGSVDDPATSITSLPVQLLDQWVI